MRIEGFWTSVFEEVNVVDLSGTGGAVAADETGSLSLSLSLWLSVCLSLFDTRWGRTSAFEEVDAVNARGRDGGGVVDVARGARARERPEPARVEFNFAE